MQSIPTAIKESARRLTATYPTPFFIFDLERLRGTFKSFTEAWSIFPRLCIAYSYKTNSLKRITRTLLTLGAAADVASGPEFDMALEDGFDAVSSIIFNGPVKLIPEIDAALRAGARINVDSLSELASVINLAKEIRILPRIGLRLASPLPDTRLSRLGLNTEECCQALDLLSRSAIQLSGLHFHVGSNTNDASPYLDTLRMYSPFLRHVVDTGARGPVWIDIGGGFPAQGLGRHETPMTFTSLASRIHEYFASLHIDAQQFELVLEPGRCLVEDCGFFVTQVVSEKYRQEERLLTVDGGTNLVRHIYEWPHPVEVLAPSKNDDHPAQSLVPSRIYGTNCFEDDIFHKRLLLPPDVTIGEHIIVGSVGAYDISSTIVWTRPLPAIIGVDRGAVSIIRPPQDHRDMRRGQTHAT